MKKQSLKTICSLIATIMISISMMLPQAGCTKTNKPKKKYEKVTRLDTRDLVQFPKNINS